jgi:uncharacterized repeat protein (TIGR03803 family)
MEFGARSIAPLETGLPLPCGARLRAPGSPQIIPPPKILIDSQTRTLFYALSSEVIMKKIKFGLTGLTFLLCVYSALDCVAFQPPVLALNLPAQYSVLHSFTGRFGSPADGSGSWSSLTLSGNVLYGTTVDDGQTITAVGTLFRINVDGTGYRILHNFDYNTPDGSGNNDGVYPEEAPLVIGNSIVGTTVAGGTFDNTQHSSGTIYSYGNALGLTSTNYSIIHTFTYSLYPFTNTIDGVSPYCKLVQVSNTLFGTTGEGGISKDTSVANGNGCIFKVNPDGSGYSILRTFLDTDATNGISLFTGLTVGESTATNTLLYGVTTEGGGPSNLGVIYRIATDGSGFKVIYRFDDNPADGGSSSSRLAYANGKLFGSTVSQISGGAIYSINTDGSGFVRLTNAGSMRSIVSPLTIYSNTLYGAAKYNTANRESGFIFSIKTDGTGYQVLHNFQGSGLGDGADPNGALTLLTNNTKIVLRCCPQSTYSYMLCRCVQLVTVSNTVLYGTTTTGGAANYGTIYALPLNVASATNSVNWLPITSPENNSFFFSPANISFTVDTASLGSVGEVDYYTGSTLIGTATSYPYSFNWINPSPGSNQITAVLSDTNGNITAASILDIFVASGFHPTITYSNYPTPNPISNSLSSICQMEYDALSGITHVKGTNTANGSWLVQISGDLLNWTNVAATTATNSLADFFFWSAPFSFVDVRIIPPGYYLGQNFSNVYVPYWSTNVNSSSSCFFRLFKP